MVVVAMKAQRHLCIQGSGLASRFENEVMNIEQTFIGCRLALAHGCDLCGEPELLPLPQTRRTPLWLHKFHSRSNVAPSVLWTATQCGTSRGLQHVCHQVPHDGQIRIMISPSISFQDSKTRAFTRSADTGVQPHILHSSTSELTLQKSFKFGT